jgi:hypothetical protein
VILHTNCPHSTTTIKHFILNQVGVGETDRDETAWGKKKTGTKQERKRRRKTKGDKKLNQKRRKDNKTWQKGNKKNEPKIKVLTHELLVSTLSYLMLAPWWYTNPSNLSSRTPPMLSSLSVLMDSQVFTNFSLAYLIYFTSDIVWHFLLLCICSNVG